jgi:hypothetical protein
MVYIHRLYDKEKHPAASRYFKNTHEAGRRFCKKIGGKQRSILLQLNESEVPVVLNLSQ